MKNKKQIFLLVITLLLLLAPQFPVVQALPREKSAEAQTRKNTENDAPKKKIENKNKNENPTGREIKNKSDNTASKDNTKIVKQPDVFDASPKLADRVEFPEEQMQTSQKQLKELSKGNTDGKESLLPDWLKWTLIGLAGLLVLGGITAGGFFLRKSIQREREETTKGFGDLRKRHGELSKEVKDLTEVTKNLSQQLAQSKVEIARIKDASQNVSSYAAASAAVATTPTINSYQTSKEESLFPISVDDFLAKSKSGAIPVKYDYKERMLVQDDAREGGLLIVRDAGDRLLYLVPSFGFFQTKSDYTNYFERYYGCARPSGGSVWIRQPATVAQTSGGWKLANQGELEVR